MQNPIKTFEPNLVGRDFVIGDLHGAFALFEKLQANLNFDPEKDRMFSVTDLIDRGPDSLKCLSLLKHPWFHGVLANHEQMMLEAFYGGYRGKFWMQNGGFWAYSAVQDWKNRTNFITDEVQCPPAPSAESLQLFDLLDDVNKLPFLITVKMKNGKKFHIIHAEFPPTAEINDEILEDPEKVMQLAQIQSFDGDFFCWGRHIFMPFFGMDLPNMMDKVKRTVALTHHPERLPGGNLSHVISGHTIMHHPLTILGQTNIDTGAYGAMDANPSKWRALTCIELDTWTFYQQRMDNFRVVTPLSVNTADIAEILHGKTN